MRPLRVLIVDDEPTIVESTSDYLRLRGFVVETAHGRAEAEALIVAVDPFDVVLTDVRLSDRGREDGLELTSFINGHSPETGVIVVTAYAGEETQRLAHARGACVVLQKPVPLTVIERNVVSIANRGARSSSCGVSMTWVPTP
jgi:DNA-binding NtrC family response regulator